MPRLGPSAVDVSATADLTPRVERTSASAVAGSPAPLVETTRSAVMPASLWVPTTWSSVVLLNSKVQLIATVRTSGVVADEKRRVAAARFDDAKNPPTGEIRLSTGARAPAAMRATIGPRKPTAVTRNIAVISDVAAAVDGELVVEATENSGMAAAIASSPPMRRPGPTPRGSTAALASARVGDTREARRPADSTANSAIVTAPPMTATIGSQPALTEKSGGAIPCSTNPSARAKPSFV